MFENYFTVEESHAANEVGSGDLSVLSTPSLIAFMENVAKEEAQTKLEAGETTVGIEVHVQHIKATAIGQKVRVTATLREQKKSILFYKVEAFEGDTLIGNGFHKRAIVEVEKFLKNV